MRLELLRTFATDLAKESCGRYEKQSSDNFPFHFAGSAELLQRRKCSNPTTELKKELLYEVADDLSPDRRWRRVFTWRSLAKTDWNGEDIWILASIDIIVNHDHRSPSTTVTTRIESLISDKPNDCLYVDVGQDPNEGAQQVSVRRTFSYDENVIVTLGGVAKWKVMTSKEMVNSRFLSIRYPIFTLEHMYLNGDKDNLIRNES